MQPKLGTYVDADADNDVPCNGPPRRSRTALAPEQVASNGAFSLVAAAMIARTPLALASATRNVHVVVLALAANALVFFSKAVRAAPAPAQRGQHEMPLKVRFGPTVAMGNCWPHFGKSAAVGLPDVRGSRDMRSDSYPR